MLNVKLGEKWYNQVTGGTKRCLEELKLEFWKKSDENSDDLTSRNLETHLNVRVGMREVSAEDVVQSKYVVLVYCSFEGEVTLTCNPVYCVVYYTATC